jgi:hypothetical protein
VLGSAEPDDESELFAGAPDPPPRRPAPAPAGSPSMPGAKRAVTAPAPEPARAPVRRGPSAQAVKRHRAAMEKATRARDVIDREVTRLEGELAGARDRLAAADLALAEIVEADPSA